MRRGASLHQSNGESCLGDLIESRAHGTFSSSRFSFWGGDRWCKRAGRWFGEIRELPLSPVGYQTMEE